MKVTILNTSIVTSHGFYTYEPCSLKRAKRIVKNNGFESAVGHESTAQVISALLSIDCKMNRIRFSQQENTSALVFKLNGRAPEGKVLTADEIEEIGYEWGILTRLPDNLVKDNIWSKVKKAYNLAMDKVVMPLVCLLLAIGLVSAAAHGLAAIFGLK
jgi:hypothetical protein